MRGDTPSLDDGRVRELARQATQAAVPPVVQVERLAARVAQPRVQRHVLVARERLVGAVRLVLDAQVVRQVAVYVDATPLRSRGEGAKRTNVRRGGSVERWVSSPRMERWQWMGEGRTWPGSRRSGAKKTSTTS
jgi:hypothetical protein